MQCFMKKEDKILIDEDSRAYVSYNLNIPSSCSAHRRETMEIMEK